MIVPVIPSQQEAFDDLVGTECRGCGKTKKPDMSFCYRCYKTLPQKMQRALYNRIGSGYEEAFAEARAYLQREAQS